MIFSAPPSNLPTSVSPNQSMVKSHAKRKKEPPAGVSRWLGRRPGDRVVAGVGRGEEWLVAVGESISEPQPSR
jgi:hypothetical protein